MARGADCLLDVVEFDRVGGGFYFERPLWRGVYTALLAWFAILLVMLVAITRMFGA